jgi:hypothetical protein
MPGKVIGKSLNYGFAGNFARNPDLIAVTRPNNGDSEIVFGTPLMADAIGGVVPVDATFTAAQFVGIAGSEVKSVFSYRDQGENGGRYAPKEPVTVIQRGSVSVVCASGTPVVGGAVFVRTVENGDKKIGDLETAADGSDNSQLTNAQWGSDADANKVAELVLLTRNRA